jgi:hypothetical protein
MVELVHRLQTARLAREVSPYDDITLNVVSTSAAEPRRPGPRRRDHVSSLA